MPNRSMLCLYPLSTHCNYGQVCSTAPKFELAHPDWVVALSIYSATYTDRSPSQQMDIGLHQSSEVISNKITKNRLPYQQFSRDLPTSWSYFYIRFRIHTKETYYSEGSQAEKLAIKIYRGFVIHRNLL